MNLRSILGCLMVLAAACGPKSTTPTGGPGNPALLCKKVPLSGTAVAGASLIHAATFSMVMIDACSFDMPRLLDAAKACHDQASCGVPVDPAGLTVVNQAANGTWTTVALGGGRAFTTKLGDRTLVAWDASRDPTQVLSAIPQGGANDVSCCPGCSPCDTAGTPACPAGGGSAPHVDTFPAPGFPDVQGPAVCACSDVCPARDRKQLPIDCECAQLCHCS
jgi:hypothetical protein